VRVSSLFTAFAFIVAAAALTPLTEGAAHAASGPAGDADLVLVDGGLAQFALVGLLQTQVVPWLGDEAFIVNGDPADSPGARLRRARLGIKGTAYGDIDYELSLQATPGGVGLLDAWVGWRPLSGLAIHGGARKVPFSRFALMAAGDSVLADRPLAVQAMAPFRQVGLTVSGDIGEGLFGWSAGVYNGFSRGQTFHEGYRESTALEGNQFTNLAYVGRIELSPLGPLSRGLADLDHGNLRISVGGSFYYDPGKTVSSMGAAGDLLLKIKGFHLAAEFLWDTAEPSEQPTTPGALVGEISRMAFVAELGYVILREQLGVTFRTEWIDDNTDLKSNGDQLILTGGVQYYFRRHHLKAGVEFTHRIELEGIALDNSSLLFQLQFQL